MTITQLGPTFKHGNNKADITSEISPCWWTDWTPRKPRSSPPRACFCAELWKQSRFQQTAYIYIYIYIYIHTYIHTYIYICIYIYIRNKLEAVCLGVAAIRIRNNLATVHTGAAAMQVRNQLVSSWCLYSKLAAQHGLSDRFRMTMILGYAALLWIDIITTYWYHHNILISLKHTRIITSHSYHYNTFISLLHTNIIIRD